jgi:hypothetical protein
MKAVRFATTVKLCYFTAFIGKNNGTFFMPTTTGTRFYNASSLSDDDISPPHRRLVLGPCLSLLEL